MSGQTEIMWSEEVLPKEQSEWTVTTLGKYVRSISDTYKFAPNEQVIFLNTSDVLLGKVLTHNFQNSALLPGQAKKRIRKGDLLFSEIRPANGRFAVVNFDAEKYVVSTKLMVIRPSPEIDLTFLTLFLTSKETLDYLQLVAEDRSGTFPQITFDHIAGLEISLPSLPEQRAIAGVLGSLDNKIDLLHRQNATLEALAKTLFRQWFTEEAKEEWEERKLGDIATHLKTSVNPLANPTMIYYQYSLPAYDNGQKPTCESGFEILSNKYKVLPNTILISKLNPQFPRIWTIGERVENNAVCSTEFQVFKPRRQSMYAYLYFLVKSEEVIEQMTMSASGTSGSHQRIRPEDILNIKVRIPSIEKAEEFSAITQGFIDKADKNRRLIQTLSNLRDTLLPKLMSGEVRVVY